MRIIPFSFDMISKISSFSNSEAFDPESTTWSVYKIDFLNMVKWNRIWGR